MEKKEQIVETFLSLVMVKNTCRISMDQLAKELKISKKTIYNFFSSKEEIIEQAVYLVFQKMWEEEKHLKVAEETDIISLLYKKTEMIGSQLRFLSNDLIKEIQLEFPRIWKLIIDIRTERIEENIAIFEKGIELGLIKPIDPKIVVHMHRVCIEKFTKQEFLIEHNITMPQACELVMSIILDGIRIQK